MGLQITMSKIAAGATVLRYWGARIDGSFYNTYYGSPSTADAPWAAADAHPNNWDLFETHAGKSITSVHWGGLPTGITTFDATANSRARSRGAFSFYSMSPSHQQVLDLAASSDANGALTTLANWATAVAAQNYPLLLRPMWEMNGNWGYAWQTNSGITTAQYIAAWRKLYEIVNAHATCVSLFWCPNVHVTGGVSDPTPWFPGTAYVDWVGFDGYNQGSSISPSSLFGPTVAIVSGLAPGKPIGIGETGCDAPTSYAGGKHQWIADFFTYLAATPTIKWFSWFNQTGSPVWPHIEVGDASTTFDGAAETAFQTGIGNSRYIDNIVNNTTFPLGSKIPIPGSVSNSGGTPGIGICQLGGSITAVTTPNIYSMVIASAGTDIPLQETVPGRALSYFNGTVVSTSFSTGVTYTQALNNGWLLKDSSGNYLVNSSFNTYGADIGSAGYRNAWITNVLAYLAAHPGIDGIFIDAVVYDPKATFGTYPALYPTTATWDTAMVGFLNAVYTAMHSHGYYVAINAQAYKSGDPLYGDGTSSINWWNTVAPHCDGLMNEYYDENSSNLGLRSLGTAWYQEWAGWQRLIGTAQGLSKDFIGLMYGTGTGPMVYGKASFLLEWNGGGSVFMFHVGSGAAANTNPTNSAWTTNIGTPVGAKVAVGVGFKRSFTGGTVLVNPSPTLSQSFVVGGITYTLTPISAKIL